MYPLKNYPVSNLDSVLSNFNFFRAPQYGGDVVTIWSHRAGEYIWTDNLLEALFGLQSLAMDCKLLLGLWSLEWEIDFSVDSSFGCGLEQ